MELFCTRGNKRYHSIIGANAPTNMCFAHMHALTRALYANAYSERVRASDVLRTSVLYCTVPPVGVLYCIEIS